jgi:hypothetical protein
MGRLHGSASFGVEERLEAAVPVLYFHRGGFFWLPVKKSKLEEVFPV